MSSRTLLALTASALALPGIAGKARGATAPTAASLGYRISNYEEDALPAGALLGGARERYDITVHQFRLVSPLGEDYALTLDGSYESMAGASPWYQLRGSDGDPGVVMSGATISEQRREVNAGFRRYFDDASVSVNVGTSRENDYESLSFGAGGERDFNNALTTVSAGFSISNDDLAPTDARLFSRVAEESKRTSSVFTSVTQVLNQTTVLQSALNITHHSGYLSDPYKQGDSRPRSRTQYAWTNAYRRFFVPLDAALHIDYRLYTDTFSVDSHTLEIDWFQNVGDEVQITPGLRWYTQSRAEFYMPVNDFTFQGHQSSDYRLAAYGAISGKLTVQAELDDFTVSASAERYLTDADYGLYDTSEENPALVDFTRLSLGVDYSF